MIDNFDINVTDYNGNCSMLNIHTNYKLLLLSVKCISVHELNSLVFLIYHFVNFLLKASALELYQPIAIIFYLEKVTLQINH